MIGLGTPAEVPAPVGTQDRLSIFFQLGLIARGRPALMKPGSRFSLPLASMREIDRPTFTVVGHESVKSAGGGGTAIDTVRITVRNEADPTDPVFDVWLAPEQSMLPARIRMQEHDGKMVDQVMLRSG